MQCICELLKLETVNTRRPSQFCLELKTQDTKLFWLVYLKLFLGLMAVVFVSSKFKSSVLFYWRDNILQLDVFLGSTFCCQLWATSWEVVSTLACRELILLPYWLLLRMLPTADNKMSTLRKRWAGGRYFFNRREHRRLEFWGNDKPWPSSLEIVLNTRNASCESLSQFTLVRLG